MFVSLLLVACSEYALDAKTPRHPHGRDTDVPPDTVETDTTGDTETTGDTDPPTDTDTTAPAEACNGVDDDGDGSVDEGFPDGDGDGTADCVDVEECDGVDNDGDGAVDEGFDANGDGVVDCLGGDDEAYCTPFDDFSGWSYTGTGDWHVESGLLTEGRAGSYAGIAYVTDLGTAPRFLIEVSSAWAGNANDLTGIAWGVSGDTAYVARWDDPQGYYGRYSPTGGMDISRCDATGCTPIAADSSADLYWPADMSFVTWSVAVDRDQVQVVVNGTPVLTATIPEIEGTGPRVAGVYSNDNDGGVWFDDFCVWSSTM